MMRSVRVFVAIATMTLASVQWAGAASADDIVDIPVSFAVTNVNHSRVPCGTDGKNYTLTGHLTGPASKLSDASTTGTLYQHGLEVGEWFWRMPVIGDSYARSMADLGHVSVTVDRLGYNTSGHANGLKTCVGGHADIAHQVIQQLRAGTYSGSIHPQFTKVGIAGHSLGGAITEIEAASFQDVDAAAVLSYADLAPTPAVLLGSLTWGPKCTLGGVKSDGVPGFAYLTRNVADYQKTFLKNTPAAALPEATASRELNPCGDFISILSAIPLDTLLITKIKVPVLVMSGTKDLVFDPARVKLQSALFRGSPKVTTKIVTGATHGITLEPTKVDIVANLDAWLTENGL